MLIIETYESLCADLKSMFPKEAHAKWINRTARQIIHAQTRMQEENQDRGDFESFEIKMEIRSRVGVLGDRCNSEE